MSGHRFMLAGIFVLSNNYYYHFFVIALFKQFKPVVFNAKVCVIGIPLLLFGMGNSVK